MSAGTEQRKLAVILFTGMVSYGALSQRNEALTLVGVACACWNELMTPDHEPDAPPPETQRLIDELYREELREARAMTPEEKILAGLQLFEGACRMTLAGIRNQNPGASEEQCREILRQRLVFQRRLEETS